MALAQKRPCPPCGETHVLCGSVCDTSRWWWWLGGRGQGGWDQKGEGSRSRQRVWKFTCGGEVSSVWSVSGPRRHVRPAAVAPPPPLPPRPHFLSPPISPLPPSSSADNLPPQVQQGLSMTSVTSMPYTSSRSTRKERSPCGSSPMALTWSAVRVGSTLPATSDSVWKMRLFSSMKKLRTET